MSRAHCSRCQRPAKTCLCAHVISCPSRLQVVVLQDPTEARHALSTAPLLALSIPQCQLVVAERADPDALLGPGWRQNALLVYPGAAAVSGAQLSSRAFNTLLLLDGTWRKVRRLWHLNPWLAELPCLRLSPAARSRYRIRKSPRSDGLSTLEAAVEALGRTQPERDFTPLLGVMDAMVELQLTQMTPGVRRRYGSADRGCEDISAPNRAKAD